MAGRLSEVKVSVEHADALRFPADTLALKHAQRLYGVDEAVVAQLLTAGIDVRDKLPGLSRSLLVETSGALEARSVLFIGVEPLYSFGYREIREFSKNVLVALNAAKPVVRHVALTVHGANYGLDEVEAFESEIAGLVDAVAAGDAPPTLERVTIIEFVQRRAQKLQLALAQLLPNGAITIPTGTAKYKSGPVTPRRLATVGFSSESRPNVFVAMPFSEDMDDVFHYGIQGAVNAAGFLCERADFSTFTGDAMAWVRQRISKSALVIAELSGANPNVYLEVGYAWGCNRPTLLLVKDASELRFDV